MKPIIITLGLAAIAIISFAQDAANNPLQLSDLNKMIAKDPGNVSLYFDRANVYDLTNAFVLSNQDFKKVVELYKKKPDEKYREEFLQSCYRLADDYFFRNSDGTSALKYLKEGLKLSPDARDLEILQALVIAADPQRKSEATEIFKALSEKYPEDSRLSGYYAKFLWKDDPLAAAVQYEKIVASQPNNRNALIYLGVIYNNEAVRMLSSATERDNAEVYSRKAAKYLEEAYRLNSADMELRGILLTMYSEIRDIKNISRLEQNVPF